jgi:hypothetical protein
MKNNQRPNFQIFIARHGEAATQALIEDMERINGTEANDNLPLKQRWDSLMNQSDDQKASA